MQRRIFSLSQKAVLALAVILLPVVITFAYGYHKNKELLKRYMLGDITVVSEAVEGQVYQFIEMSQRRAEDFSSDGFIIRALEARGNGARGAGFDKGRAALESHLRETKLPLDKHIETINVMDLDGTVIASTDGNAAGRDLSAEQYFLSGKEKSSYGEAADTRGRAQLFLSAPVRNESGRVLGVLSTHILLTELNDVLSGEFHRKLGAVSWSKGKRKTMKLYLVNGEGAIVAGSNIKNGSAPVRNAMTEPVATCLDKGTEISGFYTDYRGVEVVGASMCIPSLNWTLLVEFEAAEALAPAYELRRQAVITGIIVGGLIILLFTFFRSIVLQLQRLSSAAEAISKGDYDITIPVKTRDEIGVLAGTFNSMAQDIKERKLALEDSNKRLKSILDNSAAVVYLKDAQGRYTFINHRFETIFNVTAAEFVGKTDYDLFPTEMADAVRENDRKVLDLKAPVEFEEEMLAKGEVRTYISMKFPLFDSAGELYAVCGFSTDITERKREAVILRETEERLNTAQKVAHIGSWEWKIPENKLWWSDEIYHIFGLKTHEFGATYEAFMASVHPDDRDLVKRAVYTALYNNNPYSIEHRVVHQQQAHAVKRMV
ncbi:MAG: PAS domain-containing protein, partial [Thermodesulfobacteriota bacterium]